MSHSLEISIWFAWWLKHEPGFVWVFFCQGCIKLDYGNPKHATLYQEKNILAAIKNKVLLRAQKFLWVKKKNTLANTTLKTLCVSDIWHLQPSVSKLKDCLFRVTGMSLLVSLRSSMLRSWQGTGPEVAMPKRTSVKGGGCQGASEVCCGIFRALNEEREPSSASCLVQGNAGSSSPETSAG